MIRRLTQISADSKAGKVVLDACCGSRMFWFDRTHPEVVFLDNRRETHRLADASSSGGCRTLVIDPDVIGDFTSLPFADDRFALVVFDPPHLIRNGKRGWLAKKYGKLEGDWQEQLRKGFSECLRVLRPLGTLVFKWNEHEVPVSRIIELAPIPPLFGNRCGRTAKSHWLVFLKPSKKKSAEICVNLAENSGGGGMSENPQELLVRSLAEKEHATRERCGGSSRSTGRPRRPRRVRTRALTSPAVRVCTDLFRSNQPTNESMKTRTKPSTKKAAPTPKPPALPALPALPANTPADFGALDLIGASIAQKIVPAITRGIELAMKLRKPEPPGLFGGAELPIDPPREEERMIGPDAALNRRTKGPVDKVPSLQMAVDVLHGAIKGAHEMLDQLGVRLEGLLPPENPNGCSVAEPPTGEVPAISPIVHSVMLATGGARHVCNRIGSMLDRLQLEGAR